MPDDMRRRRFLAAVGTTALPILAGCSGSESESSESEGDGGGDSEDSNSGNEGSEESSSENGSGDEENNSEDDSEDDSGSEDEDEEEEESSSSSSSDLVLEGRVSYDGDWTGAMGTAESTNSIEGSGEETMEYDINPDDFVSVSINAQKDDDSSDELVVEILENGEVVADASTTAEYGVASTSYSDF